MNSRTTTQQINENRFKDSNDSITMLRTISHLMILLLVGSIFAPLLSTSDEVSVFDSRVAVNSPTNPYVVPTLENYSGERINFSMSQFQWSDYTSFVSQINEPDVMHFTERQDNTILILLNPGHNGQMINNETFDSGDSILLNILIYKTYYILIDKMMLLLQKENYFLNLFLIMLGFLYFPLI